MKKLSIALLLMHGSVYAMQIPLPHRPFSLDLPAGVRHERFSHRTENAMYEIITKRCPHLVKPQTFFESIPVDLGRTIIKYLAPHYEFERLWQNYRCGMQTIMQPKSNPYAVENYAAASVAIAQKDNNKTLRYTLDQILQNNNTYALTKILQAHKENKDLILTHYLALAVRRCSYDFIKALIDHGVSVDEGRYLNLAPLAVAVMRGRIDTIRLLHSQTHMVCDALTPTMNALLENTYEREHLNSTEAKRWQECNWLDQTPLHIAAMCGLHQAYEIGIECGADPEKKDTMGKSPFHYAVQNGHVDLVERIISSSSTSFVGNGVHNDQFLTFEVSSHDWHVYELMSSSCSGVEGKTPLSLAISNNHRDMVQKLIQMHADIMQKSRFASYPSLTPLQMAVIGGNVSIFDELLKSGASINDEYVDPMDDSRATLLDLAITDGHAELIAPLLQAGLKFTTEVDELTGAILPPLFYAIYKGDQMTHALIQSGANVNEWGSCDGDFTPLTIAAEHGWEALVQELLDAGADINAQKNGRSALRSAVIGVSTFGVETTDTIQLLLHRGADPRNVEVNKDEFSNEDMYNQVYELITQAQHEWNKKIRGDKREESMDRELIDDNDDESHMQKRSKYNQD